MKSENKKVIIADKKEILSHNAIIKNSKGNLLCCDCGGNVFTHLKVTTISKETIEVFECHCCRQRYI